MNVSEQQSDLCPHCHSPFEIVFLKIGFRCTAMIASCPNCAVVCPDNWGTAKTKTLDHWEQSARISRGIWQRTVSMLDQINLRYNRVPVWSSDHGSRSAPRRSCLWRVLPRRNPHRRANGSSSCCASSHFLPKKAPPIIGAVT